VIRPGEGAGKGVVGVVFAYYWDVEGAILARNTLRGARFDGRVVETGF
jgi:hypothetical protein